MVITIPAIGAKSGGGLRPLNPARDMHQVVQLLRLVFGTSFERDEGWSAAPSGFGPGFGQLFAFGSLTSRLSNGFVWEANGRIVGNVTLMSTSSWGRYLVANVAVHPDYRRQGIAYALMEAVGQAAVASNGRVVLLQVVKDNYPALGLYQRLGYRTVGNMTTWYAPMHRLRPISPGQQPEGLAGIRELARGHWQAAYDLDSSRVPPDLNWPEPLHPDAYRTTFWRRLGEFLTGRQFEAWSVVDDGDRLCALVSIAGEWGRAHLLSLRVGADWVGQLERPLLAKAIRRLKTLPRRAVRVDHPDDDILVNTLLREANLAPQRTLTHMRLDLQ